MINLFICYARADQEYLDRLEIHLHVLQQQLHLIGEIHERDITANSRWMREIDPHLRAAHVILVLVSPDFLALPYFDSDEFKLILQRHEQGEARIIPVIVRSGGFLGHTPLASYQALPRDARPISAAQNLNNAMADLVLDLRNVIEEYIQTVLKKYVGAVAHCEDLEREVVKYQGLEKVWQQRLVDQQKLFREQVLAMSSGHHRSPSPVPRWYRLSLLVNIGLCIVLLFVLLLPRVLPLIIHSSACSLPCITLTSDNQAIGISDGSDNFRSWQTAQPNSVINMTQQMIQKQNNQVNQSTFPFVTLIVLTTLSPGVDAGYGQDDLQGIAALQAEVNASNCQVKNCLHLRLLVANAGTNMQYASTVMQQIDSLKANDKSIIGIVGLPVSTTYAIQAIQQEAQTQQPLVMMSATESSDALTGISPYYFRIAPPDSEQGAVDADQIVQQSPAVHTAIVFYADDPIHPYGRTLSSAFVGRFTQNKQNHVFLETYNAADTTRSEKDQQTSTISNELKALPLGSQTPYVIYFAGYTDTLGRLLDDLHSDQFAASDLQEVVSGNAAYDLADYVGSVYKNLYFSAFAFPDEWGVPPRQDSDPCHIVNNYASTLGPHFFCEYANDFDPQHIPYPHPYGYTRADSNVIQAYDSARVMIEAYVQTLNNPSVTISKVLVNDGQHAFAGVSGQIVFGSNGNPINKPIVWLSVNSQGHTSSQGFIQGKDPTTSLPTYNWS